MNKIFRLCFAIILLATAVTFSSQAAHVLYRGTCGADGINLTWTLDSEGTLTIEGRGEHSECKLNSILHSTILERAVQMALQAKGIGVSN